MLKRNLLQMIKDIAQEGRKFKRCPKALKEWVAEKHHYSFQLHNKRSIPIYVHNNGKLDAFVRTGGKNLVLLFISFPRRSEKCFDGNWINLSFELWRNAFNSLHLSLAQDLCFLLNWKIVWLRNLLHFAEHWKSNFLLLRLQAHPREMHFKRTFNKCNLK